MIDTGMNWNLQGECVPWYVAQPELVKAGDLDDLPEAVDEHYTGPAAPGELEPRGGSGQSDNEYVQLSDSGLYMTASGWGRFEDALVYTRSQTYESEPVLGGEFVSWDWARCRESDYGPIPL